MKKSKLFLILTIVIVLTFIVIVLGMMAFGVIDIKLKNNLTSQKEKKKKDEIQLGKIDDWEYDEKKYANDYSKSINYSNSFAAYDSVSEGLSAPSSSTLGFSTGGAKDINNFRENIKEGYFPLVSDITYEGVYYDYYFDTGKDLREYDEMFYSTATTAVSKDPISEKNEYYVSVGLNSNIKQEDFSRKN
jgi:Ca-activated chloride channel family protein